MGLFGGKVKMPMVKEIEIDCECESGALIAALQQAKLKAKNKGDCIMVSSGLFSPVKCSGTILNADGEWTGTIVISGNANVVAKYYAQFSACLKKFTKK